MADLDRANIKRRESMIRNTPSTELTAKYDYCMVFKMDGEVGNYKLSKAAKFVMNQLKNAKLDVFAYYSVQYDELIMLIRCPVEVMKDFADEIDFAMEFAPEKVKEMLEAGYAKDGEYVIKPIEINDATVYSPISPYNYIYGRYDTDVDQDLYADFENEKTMSSQYDPVNPPFNKYIRLKLIHYLLRAPVRQGGCALKLTKLLYKKKLLAYFPVHDRLVTAQIKERLMKYDCYPWNFPFNDFRYYFGERIALFHVFLGHYSYWLIWPSFIGFIFQMVVWGTQNYSHPVLPFYSLMITIWCIFMLEYWKREEKLTAMRWGMTKFEDSEPDLPEFHGEVITSYIDGSSMTYFPADEFVKRVCRSQTIIGSFIGMVLGVVASIYVLRFSLQTSIGTNASLVASILNTVQITVFNYIYQIVAIRLTDSENHRTDTQYEDSMIVKLFMFQFVNSYASFFFLAFIASSLNKSDDGNDDNVGQCGASNCMEPLAINLAIIFGTRLIVKNLTDILIPWVSAKKKRENETKGVASDKILTPAEEDYVLMTYDSMIQNIANYADAAIQFGFAVLFVTALPIASFLSLLSNYVKTKLIGWKLCVLYQRPIPSGAQDIGTWLTIFQFISVAAVITNAGLICFTMDVLNVYDIYGRSWIFIGFQWTLIALQFIIEQIIPDEPEEAVIQQGRNDFIVSKIVDHKPDEEAVPVDKFSEWKANSKNVEDDGDNTASGLSDFAVQTYPASGLVNATGNPMV